MKRQSEMYPYSCNQLSDKEALDNLQKFLEQYGSTVIRIAVIASIGSLPAFAEGTTTTIPKTGDSPASAPAPGNGAVVPAQSPTINNWSEGMGIAAVAITCASAVFPPTILGIIGCGFVMASQILKHMK